MLEPERDAGLRLVIFYKLAKGTAELALSAALALLTTAGLAGAVQSFAFRLGHHVPRAWSLQLSTMLVRAATPRHLELTALALALDGVLTWIEGWALHRRRPWGPWLVVVVSGLLLPFELVELFREVRPSRLLILVANGAIVAYMARRIARRGGARKPT